ncbi:MAG: hypothetical protein PHF14_07545 [Verrucomicrobiota bacterium]|nr:hypothetical protein [Verrucomicrobiota bacterium]
MKRWLRLIGIGTVVCGVMFGSRLGAQEAEPALEPTVESVSSPPLPPAVVPPVEISTPGQEPEAPMPVEEEPKPDRFLEQRVYITYEQLQKVFEREGRGVYLPYDQFLALWEKAQASEEDPEVVEPPLDYLIRGIDNRLEVEGDVVRVVARLEIELFREGWIRVPLRLADAAITRATVGGEPARVVADAEQGHVLLVLHEGSEPAGLELELEYAKAFTKSPGRNEVTFMAPQAPVNRWDVRIPEEGVQVEITPLLAASQVTDEATTEAERAKQTRVLAFVGPAPMVGVRWTPKAEGAQGLDALVRVQSEQKVRIDEGVMRTNAALHYMISRAELETLKVRIPADQKVVQVFDPNIRQWRVESEGTTQLISMELFEPARGDQQVILELERYWAEGGETTAVSVPVVNAEAVGRQVGTIVVGVAAGLRAEALSKSGLMQIDLGELPETLRGDWVFAYRYSVLPYELTLDVEKIEPRVLVDTLAEAFLEAQELRLVFQSVYRIERAGIFRMEWALPAGYQVRRVWGFGGDGIVPVQVDSHHVTGDGVLVVNLSNRALGAVGLAIELAKDLAEPDLLQPTGNDAAVAIGFGRPPAESVERFGGRFILYAPENLRVNPSRTDGLRPVSVQEAKTYLAGISSAPEGRPVLAFSFTEDPVELELAAQRRKPYTTVRQMLVSRIESGVVKVRADLFLKVQYSGVKAVRLDLPAEVAGWARVTTPGVRHAEEEGADLVPPLEPGMVAWRLMGESEFLGDTIIQLEWEQPLDGLDLGKSVALEIPRLIPRGVDRTWGQIVLAKAETIDLQAAAGLSGLQPIDPAHDLMEGVSVADAAWAFEFHQDWELPLIVTKYELLEAIKSTSIERALVTMVWTRSKEQAVQALYRVRSVQQRLLLDLPKDVVFDTDPLRVNGRSVPLERGEGDQYYIPLVGQEPDRPFLLEVRYTLPERGARFVLPNFPEEPAVQEVRLAVYLPQERVYLGMRGPWTPEFAIRYGGFGGMRPHAYRHRASLLDWVATGVPGMGTMEQNFPVDGQYLLFSAVHPAMRADAALRLVSMNGRVFHGLVLILMVGLGVGLLRVAPRLRWGLLGLYFCLVMAAGLFWPSFTSQLMGQAAFIAVLILALLWLCIGGCIRGATDLWMRFGGGGRRSALTASAGASGVSSSEGEGIAAEQAGEGSPEADAAGDGSILGAEDIRWDEDDEEDRHA